MSPQKLPTGWIQFVLLIYHSLQTQLETDAPLCTLVHSTHHRGPEFMQQQSNTYSWYLYNFKSLQAQKSSCGPWGYNSNQKQTKNIFRKHLKIIIIKVYNVIKTKNRFNYKSDKQADR